MIRQFINQVVDAIAAPRTGEDDAGSREGALRAATAVLLLDVARSDNVFEESEFERVLGLVEKHFGMSPEDAAELVNAADEKAEELVSLHEFTQLLHNNLDESEKARIVGLLWQVAYADGRLDKYEDSLVRKISDLLHVSRGRSMRLKHDAERTAR
ncbi:MAG TPA: TerB family tellurite resistance protein [Woeseiaceae bacterium]|nr:TerB family tellurite resistance protein [Woeseiaceae bacterium]